MIDRQPTKKGDMVKVIFTLPNNMDGDQVAVVGDFNAWSTSAMVMKPHGDVLTASVMLAAGRRYAFRYYSRGQWFNDDAADSYEPNEYGATNSVVELKSAEEAFGD